MKQILPTKWVNVDEDTPAVKPLDENTAQQTSQLAPYKTLHRELSKAMPRLLAPEIMK